MQSKWVATAATMAWLMTAASSQAVLTTQDHLIKYPSGYHYSPPAAAAPAPAAPVMAKPAANNSCAVANTSLTSMSKSMPAEASLGQEFTYELNVVALDCIGDVQIVDVVPDGASYVSSSPAAQVSGNTLRWSFPKMDAGDRQTIKVTLKADKEGTLASCATIHALPRACGSTFVGKPVLAIEKSGPAKALLNSDVAYTIVVKNTGSSVAKNVVVTDTVPAGLAHASGQSKLTFNVGDMAPNTSRTIPVTLKATQRGRHCNVAEANSSNAGKVSDDACTEVLTQGLDIVKTGEEKEFLNKIADYTIKVTNTGDTDLSNVTVVDSAPAATSIVSADGAAVAGNQATWRIPVLKAGDSKSFSLKLTSVIAGRHCNIARVSTQEGLSKSAEACTVWSGLPALLIELVDDPDPIQVGEVATYTIRVTNQGTADDTNIKVVTTFPAELTPMAASSNGSIAGKVVTFPAYPRLAPKQFFEYTIQAKGSAAGIAVTTVRKTSDYLVNGVSEEESTRVY